MSSKYAFTKALKEVRFLFCQTGEHSAATRYVLRLPLQHTGALSIFTLSPPVPPFLGSLRSILHDINR
ncbi:NADH-ubiquinone oxidoreductase 10.5 kDa subunit [Colletotrichum tanaceti]|nr:NADH-ubiquinone oxidoreductase 10.5 kDa subunit [Colletotrichum tanaceti]